MSSSSRQSQLRRAIEIRRNGIISPFPCDFCFSKGIDCYAMPSSSLKCSECVRRGKPCVNLSWASLDRTRDEYEKKVAESEKQLSEVIARLLREKKILAQANERAKAKLLCDTDEARLAGEEVDAIAQDPGCPAGDAQIGLSPAIWSITDLLDTSAGINHVTGEGTWPIAGGNS